MSRIRSFMEMKPEGFESLEDVAAAISAYQPHRVRPQRLEGLAKNVRRGEDGKYRWHWDPQFMNGLNYEPQRLEHCARGLALPTLLVRGGQSDVLSEAGAQAFLRLCPKALYFNALDAGHMVVGDRNDVFGAAAISFLKRVVPVGGTPKFNADDDPRVKVT